MANHQQHPPTTPRRPLSRAERDHIRWEIDRITRLEKIRPDKHGAFIENSGDTSWQFPPPARYIRETVPEASAILDEAGCTPEQAGVVAAAWGMALAEITDRGHGFPLPSVLRRRKT